ncbi:MAG: Uma2 family endonuclease [Ktedonobacteraceae bacterium]
MSIAINREQVSNDPTVVTPADWVPGPRQGFWTYEAYASLPEDGRQYEIVQGVLMMTPAPEPIHQGIVGEIYDFLRSRIVDTKRGLVLTSPIDVVFSENTNTQPDVLVLLKEHLDHLQEKRILGAPDLIVEIISPSSVTYDRLVKHTIYEQAGVPEYWLVRPKAQTIEVFALETGKYRSLGIFKGEQCLISRIVPDITVPVSQFFDWTHGLL